MSRMLSMDIHDRSGNLWERPHMSKLPQLRHLRFLCLALLIVGLTVVSPAPGRSQTAGDADINWCKPQLTTYRSALAARDAVSYSLAVIKLRAVMMTAVFAVALKNPGGWQSKTAGPVFVVAYVNMVWEIHRLRKILDCLKKRIDLFEKLFPRRPGPTGVIGPSPWTNVAAELKRLGFMTKGLQEQVEDAIKAAKGPNGEPVVIVNGKIWLLPTTKAPPPVGGGYIKLDIIYDNQMWQREESEDDWKLRDIETPKTVADLEEKRNIPDLGKLTIGGALRTRDEIRGVYPEGDQIDDGTTIIPNYPTAGAKPGHVGITGEVAYLFRWDPPYRNGNIAGTASHNPTTGIVMPKIKFSLRPKTQAWGTAHQDLYIIIGGGVGSSSSTKVPSGPGEIFSINGTNR